MARPTKSEAPNLDDRVNLTVGAIERVTCPVGKQQAFMRDTEVPGLRVRVTAAGAKSFVFESKLNRQTIRRTIGDVKVWTIEQARTEARRLAVVLDGGQDPREIERQQAAEVMAERQRVQSTLVRERLAGIEAWAEYVKEGREVGYTDRGPWSARHAADHDAMAAAGGVAYKRKSQGVTQPGPLRPLLSLPLVKIDAPTVAQWLKEQNAHRPARAALAFRLLRGFLNWCAEHPVYSTIAKTGVHEPKEVRRLVRKQTPKDDVLQREHLPAWFAAVLADGNPYARAYLLALLLTGARKNELSGLAWEDADFRFGGTLTIRDKVDGLRVIPCPAYLAHILAQLPRRGRWVFGPDGEAPNVGDTAAYNHRKVLAVGGLPHVSLHGLRRSFGSLAEWVECPAGVVAQLMGHKPSATAEKHYRARPLDLLRIWHEKIVAWMLEQAGIVFDAKAVPGALRVVQAA